VDRLQWTEVQLLVPVDDAMMPFEMPRRPGKIPTDGDNDGLSEDDEGPVWPRVRPLRYRFNSRNRIRSRAPSVVAIGRAKESAVDGLYARASSAFNSGHVQPVMSSWGRSSGNTGTTEDHASSRASSHGGASLLIQAATTPPFVEARR
jgi:hypothetical protein